MKKYNPTIFVGLGGSGTKTIKFLRERCKANPEYQDLVDNQFIFAALDTDAEDLRASGIPDENQIKTSENVNVARYIEDKKNADDTDFFSWWPTDTGMLNTKPLDKGAGQIRITSRLGYHYQMENNNLLGKVNAILTKVQGITSNVDTSDNMLRIYVIASMAGGTGSAIFTMVGYLIRELLRGRKVDMRAVLMMPEVFCQGSQEASLYNRLRANGYASLKELESAISFADSAREYIDYIPPFNYLAQPDFQSNIIENADRYLAERPYDWCVLFDKVRDSGIPFETPGAGYENYYREIAHCLYMRVFSPIAISAGSAEDNFINSLLKAVKAGQKSRRYSSFGFSALIFPRDDIAWRLAYEYLDKVFGEEGYWLKADEEFKKSSAGYERDKAEGKPVTPPKRAEKFVDQVKHLMDSIPVPFKGIVCRVDGNKESDNPQNAYDDFWKHVLIEFNKAYKENVLDKHAGFQGDDMDSNITSNIGSKEDLDVIWKEYNNLYTQADNFRKNHLPSLIERIFAERGQMTEKHLFINLIAAPDGDGGRRNVLEIRYLVSRLFTSLEVLKANVDLTASKGASFASELEKKKGIYEKKADILYPVLAAINKVGYRDDIKSLHTKFFKPHDELFSYKLSSYDNATFKRGEDDSILSEDNPNWSNQGWIFLSMLSSFIGLMLEKLHPVNAGGLLSSIHMVFDNMADLRRQINAGLETVKESGRFEDLTYPDNSKVFVYSGEKAIEAFKQEILKMDSEKVLGEFYSSITESVLGNWRSLINQRENFAKQALDLSEINKRMKDEAHRRSKTVVNEVREDMVLAVFKQIQRHPSLDLSVGAALEAEARLMGNDTAREIEDFKKDKVKSAFGLSSPFIRISKGDNRVNSIKAYTCTAKVSQELGPILEEYVKGSKGLLPETSHDKLEESNDNRVFFYQSYLAFDLGMVENLFTGNGSLKAAYYQELRDSAITPHIHREWDRELEDLDAYFNQQMKAFFLIWLSLGAEGAEWKDSAPLLLVKAQEGKKLEVSVVGPENWEAAKLEDFMSNYSKTFASSPLKIEETNATNLISVYKQFRVNFGMSDGKVSHKKLEQRLVDKVQNKNETWVKNLDAYLTALETYLNAASTRKSKTSVFAEQLYNSTLAFAKRADEALAWAAELRVTGEKHETFFWPVVG